MDSLSKEQIDFLEHHQIPIELTFNAKGLSSSQYKVKMKILKKAIAYNVTPCQKLGHTLRTRAGHCAQCNTSRLAYQLRHDGFGYVYIAGTRTGKLIKVGFTNGLKTRSESLNKEKYGGFADWEILLAIKSLNAGEVESKIKTQLKEYSFKTIYSKEGKFQDASEQFSCSYLKAKETLLDYIHQEKIPYKMEFDKKNDDYNFKNLKQI